MKISHINNFDTDKIFKTKLNKWIIKAIDEVKLNSLAQDIHLDEIFRNDFQLFSTSEVLLNSYHIFAYLINYINKKKIDISNIEIFLSIDLESEHNVFTGLPKSLEGLEGIIDLYSVPEIIVYYDLNPSNFPLIEFYRVPILFEPFIGNDNITMFYKEYRSIEEYTNNSAFTRDINIVYNK